MNLCEDDMKQRLGQGAKDSGAWKGRARAKDSGAWKGRGEEREDPAASPQAHPGEGLALRQGV